jgi:acetoin:2,6-dichlorophenolindophenol oxidoreductase subunit alpha
MAVETPADLVRYGLEGPQLRDLYTLLLRTRLLDERMRKLFKAGRFAGTYFSAVGQEATTVGPTYALRPTDWVAPSHRELGALVAKRVPVETIVAQVYARRNSPDKGKSHPCHYSAPEHRFFTPASTVAGNTVVGVGIALAFKIRREDSVVACFFGEGSTSRGGWHEAVNFAGVQKLPVVFVCQNNLWAESVPASLQSAIVDYSDRAKAYGIPGVTIDGNDVLETYRVARDAVARARAGDGPTLIEAKTYRWYGHSEIDPADYRTQEELEHWKTRDPVPRLERQLMAAGVIDAAYRETVVADIDREVDAAAQVCEATPYAAPEEALEDVYAPVP